jgi:hypothetical protein
MAMVQSQAAHAHLSPTPHTLVLTRSNPCVSLTHTVSASALEITAEDRALLLGAVGGDASASDFAAASDSNGHGNDDTARTAAAAARLQQQKRLEGHIRSLQSKYEVLNPSIELLNDIEQQRIDMRLMPNRVRAGLATAPSKAYPASPRVRQLIANSASAASSFPAAQPQLRLPLPLPSPSPAFGSPFAPPVVAAAVPIPPQQHVTAGMFRMKQPQHSAIVIMSSICDFFGSASAATLFCRMHVSDEALLAHVYSQYFIHCEFFVTLENAAFPAERQ